MQNIIIVGLGGFAGSVLRYLISGWVQNISRNPLFPYGTLGVNVLGCLLTGLLGGWADDMELFSPSVRLFPAPPVARGLHNLFHVGGSGHPFLPRGPARPTRNH